VIPINLPPFLAPRNSLQIETGGKALPKLAPNQVVHAKILKLLAGDAVLISINGREVTARTKLPLKPGRTMAFRIENTRPLPTLKPVAVKLTGNEAALVLRTLAAIKQNVWQSAADLAGHGKNADVAMFKALMQEISQGLFTRAEPGLLGAIIDKSGLNLEAKLKKGLMSNKAPAKWLPKLLGGDLKGLAGRILGQQPETAAVLEKFIGTLEDIQLLNQQGFSQEGKLFLPVPFQLGDNFFTMGQLLLQVPGEPEEARRGADESAPFYRAVFMLEMSRLGPLRAEMGIRAKTIFGKLWLTDSQSTRLVKKELPVLTEALGAHGFRVDYFECSQKDPAAVCQSLIDEILPTDQGGYDVVA
jgi:hypothetical protein